jgi:hypothetical protein
MILYSCLDCPTKTINYYYIKNHINNTNHNINNICCLCSKLYDNNHYSNCFGITLLLLSYIN